ncbi:MAG: peptide deformylase [Proteobacteria bacterium]|nr:peptide deformylase [Pseudomonadota bacterium]
MEILQYPDIRLFNTSVPIVAISRINPTLLAEMRYAVTAVAGGIAAVQLGDPVQLICIKFGSEELFLVNPQVVREYSPTIFSNERCLSINKGRSTFVVSRYEKVKVRYTSLDNITKVRKFLGKDSYVVQHEIDHLNGKLVNQK